MTRIPSLLLILIGITLELLSVYVLPLLPYPGTYYGYIPPIIGMALGGATILIALTDILWNK